MVAAPHAMAPQETTRGGRPGRRVGVCANASSREDAEYGVLSPAFNRRPIYRRNHARHRPRAAFGYGSAHYTSYATRLVPTCRHLIIFSFFYKGICLKNLVVCDYRPHGAEGLSKLLFARRSRAAEETRFHYRDQLRVADLLVSEAPFFEPLVRRAESLASGRAPLTSDDDRVLRAFLRPRSVVPTVLGLQALLRPLEDTFLPRHLHVLAGGVAAMVTAGVVQLVAYVRPHQVPAIARAHPHRSRPPGGAHSRRHYEKAAQRDIERPRRPIVEKGGDSSQRARGQSAEPARGRARGERRAARGA